MHLSPKSFRILMVIMAGFLFSGCMEEVDFGQADDFHLRPGLEVDLVFFDLDAALLPELPAGGIESHRERVALEVLSSEFVRKNLSAAELYFRQRNSFSRPFDISVRFLSASGAEQLRIDFQVAPGTPEQPVVTHHTEVIGEERIKMLKESTQMEIILEMGAMEGSGSGAGALNFASKGLFKFEI